MAAPKGNKFAKGNAGGGRPSKYEPGFVRMAKKAADLGATDRDVAELLGVSETTVNAWKLQHEEFSEALKVGKETADTRVEQSLYRRALGYSHDAVKIAVNAAGEVTQVPFTETYPPDTTAAIFWLKNRKPTEWRDVKAVESSGPAGGPIQHEHGLDIKSLTEDQLRALASIKVPSE